MSKRFHDLEIPHQWENYWTKYPHGFTIYEALIDWVNKVNDMVTNVNDWNEYLDGFVDNFEFELRDEVQQTITKWQDEGLLDDIIGSALNTELDTLKTQMAENTSLLNDMGVTVDVNDVVNGDWTPAIDNAFTKMVDLGVNTVRLPAKAEVTLKTNLRLPFDNFTLDGSGATIDGTALTIAIGIFGSLEDKTRIINDVKTNDIKISVVNANPYNVGDMVEITTDEVFNIQRPDQFFKCELNEVLAVDKVNHIITLKTPVIYDYDSSYNLEVGIIKPRENITLKNFTINMNPNNNGGNAISFNFFKNVKTENITVNNAIYSGIKFTQGINAKVDKCTVYGSRHDTLGYGLYFNTVQVGYMLNSFGDNCRHSFEVGGASKFILIENCYAQNDTSFGFATHGNTEFVTFSNCTAKGCKAGFTSRGRTATIKDCLALNNTGIGFNIGEAQDHRDGEAGKNLMVVGNRAIDNGNHGFYSPIKLYRANIKDNLSLRNNGMGFIFNASGMVETTLDNNQAIENTDVGFDIRVSTTIGSFINLVLSNNRSVRNKVGLIFRGRNDLCKNVKFINNTVTESLERGVEIQSGEFEDLLFHQNYFDGNGWANFTFDAVIVGKPLKWSENRGMPIIYDPARQATSGENGLFDIPIRKTPKRPNIFLTVDGNRIAFVSVMKTDADGNYIGATGQVRRGDTNEPSEGDIVYILVEY